MARDDRQADLLRQFEAVIGGAELDDLRRLAEDLFLLGPETARPPARPRAELRRPRLREHQRFVIRADLRHAKPPIWRRLEVRSDLTLDVVHRVLQAAFSWTDSHLWRFSLGGEPFEPASQAFLCPWDVEEGESDDEGGIPAAAVRLDEVMQVPGEILSYVYDYGDHWDLALRLENVLPADPRTPSAVAIDGRQAAPPEDCGSLRTAEELGQVLEDVARFDLEEVNEALRSPFIVLREYGFDARLVALIDRLTYSPVGDELTSRVLSLLSERPVPGEEELRASLKPFVWLLDRAAVEGGIPLTTSGYLTPADVRGAAAVLPTAHGWLGTIRREVDVAPVLYFRKALQSLGLLRRYKASLQLTRAGRDAQAASPLLWNHLASRLVPSGDGFDTEATLLLLAYAATSTGAELPLDAIATALTHLGWRSDGAPVAGYDLYRLRVCDVLRNVSDPRPPLGGRWRINAAAAELARAAVLKP